MSKAEKISIAYQGETESIEFSSNFSVLEKKIKKAFDLGEKLIKATFTGKDLGGITSFEDEESKLINIFNTQKIYIVLK